MALINRISRLFRADFNAVLDRIEEPDVVLKQALREMEEDIYNCEHRFKLMNDETAQVESKIKEIGKMVELIDEELDICFDSNKPDLARSHIKKKLEMQHYGKSLKYKGELLIKKTNELRHRIEENKIKYTSIQQKFELLVDEEMQFSNDDSFSAFNSPVDNDEIEIAFLREKQLRSVS